ncbi:hypothetical protein [Clostridium sp. 'White wine YQ']|uniref:hypothetical protein n=1 Tax=Clostridium sp. 'White wine YQ' TaxID=3027474 RepID=UPI0023659258|nr:hypothetical protein [Clostridium sp. 'White wine YQ']MDD7795366.1 hypothetical protein [Clostridium sp. 'White wine YQ']
MSQIRKIKILYTLSLTLFIDIVWSFIIRIIFRQGYDYKLFIILLVSAFSIGFFKEKISNKYVNIAIPTAISLFLNSNFLYNVIVVAFLCYIIYETKETTYDFFNIEGKVKYSIGILFILGFLDSGRNIRLYIIFIIVSVLLQRESRAFSYKMKSSAYGNLVIAITSVLLTIDKVFLPILGTLKRIIDFLWLPISYIILAFAYILSFVFSYAIKAIEVITSNKVHEQVKVDNNTSDNTLVQIEQITHFPPIIKIIIELATIIFILFIVYKLYKTKKVSKRVMDNFIEIETENIYEAKIRKRVKYKYDKDIRSKILYLFLKFEVLAKNKGLYKNFMTAEELGRSTKRSINKANEIDILVNNYNEVKFSNHIPTNRQYEDIKENYKILKKEL